MSSLRASIARLPRFAPGTVNLSDVAEFVHMARPLSVRALAAALDALPESVDFHSTIVTGAALGGELTITLNKDGSWRFRGFMRATGIPSFTFRVSAVIRSAGGRVTLAAPHSGTVFGTDTPGDRQHDWDETGREPNRMKPIRNVWPDLSAGSLVVSRSSELDGTLGSAVDIVKDAVEFLIVAETLGAGPAICLVIASELGDAGVEVPGLGGVVGLGIVGGSVFIWGPLAIGPAIVLGIAAGAVVDAMVKIRRLDAAEMAFARVVFADSIDFEHVRLTNLLGLGGRPFVMPTIDNTILVNLGGAVFDAPTTTATDSYPAKGQQFIHELTHVWQIQHARLEDGYVPGWLCAGIVDGTYTPGPAGPEWCSFGIEAQGSIVDRWFAGKKTAAEKDPNVPALNAMDENSPYFRYINDNVRLGVASASPAPCRSSRRALPDAPLLDHQHPRAARRKPLAASR